MTHDYDIIIIGNGLAGSSLALAIQHLPIRIAILDHKPFQPSPIPSDTRPITLTHTSQRILATINQWQPLEEKTNAIQKLQISEQGRFGQINLHASDIQVPALGYVAPYSQLYHHLQQSLTTHSAIDCIHIGQLQQIDNDTNGASIHYLSPNNTHHTLTASLLVVADGTQSTSRQLLQIDHETKDYGDRALIFEAELTSSQQHQTAFQRFTSQGSLAWLPSYQPNHARLVWTIPQRKLSTISNHTTQDFIQHFNAVYRGRATPITDCQQTGDFPLLITHVAEPTRPSVVIIGNAAHSFYPITAQGYNLTLLNIAALAEVLTKAFFEHQPLGHHDILQRYQTWRNDSQHIITKGTRMIDSLFGLQLPLAGQARGFGMLLTDMCSIGKRRLAQQFLGQHGQMPKLACGIALNTSTKIAETAETI